MLIATHGFNGTESRITTRLQALDHEWILTVGYDARLPQWKLWAVVVAILGAFIMSKLVMMVLLQKQWRSDVLAERSTLLIYSEKQRAEAERDLNDYIAHEVRNPLSAAISAASFVSSAIHETDPLLNDKTRQSVREDMKIISSSLCFINDLLRSMLDIHRAANKQLTLHKSSLDILKDVFEPVASMLYTRDENFRVIIICPENLIIQADRLRLKQVILNLARNAAKFCTKGFIRLRASVEDEAIILSVEDSGPGIPEEKRGVLFDRFQRSLDVTSQGTGVGLNLCKYLVELMGGELWLDEGYQSGIEACPGARLVVDLKVKAAETSDSNKGHVTSDTYVLKESDRTETGRTEDEFCDTSSSSGDIQEEASMLPENLKILFVDDDRILRRLAARSIARIAPQWTVEEAASGERALQLIENDSFDLIFMDQYMTSAERQLLGTETVREMRSKGVQSVICGLSANDLIQTFEAAGANSFWLKPFPCKEAELRRMLSDLLSTDEFIV